MSTVYNFLTKDIKEIKTDVLIFWTSSSLLAGDEKFIEIHNAAGSSLRTEVYNIKYNYKLENFKFGENIMTSAGILYIDKLIHCVSPNCRIQDNSKHKLSLLSRTLYNIKSKITAFEDLNYKFLNVTFLPLSEKIYGPVTNKDLKFFLENIYTNFSNFHEVTFIFSDKQEQMRYKRIFKKINKTRLKKIKAYARYFKPNFKI
jgi:O-acetyl-ADP-ribose deacetylase (regulator of RNase III)